MGCFSSSQPAEEEEDEQSGPTDSTNIMLIVPPKNGKTSFLQALGTLYGAEVPPEEDDLNAFQLRLKPKINNIDENVMIKIADSSLLLERKNTILFAGADAFILLVSIDQKDSISCDYVELHDFYWKIMNMKNSVVNSTYFVASQIDKRSQDKNLPKNQKDFLDYLGFSEKQQSQVAYAEISSLPSVIGIKELIETIVLDRRRETATGKS